MRSEIERRLGVAIVGFGGAVASTAAAGVELMRCGRADRSGLPLADARVVDLIGYERLTFAGWDLFEHDLSEALRTHGVLDHDQLAAVSYRFRNVRPWPAASDVTFCKNVIGQSVIRRNSKRAQVDAIEEDLRRFKSEIGDVVVINLASTERPVDLANPALHSRRSFERALDESDPIIGPAMLYAYAAIAEKVPFANFTPSVAAEVPALVEFARDCGVPLAGKDGKTGQTLMKTVIAPALRARALHVDGWYSTNMLGNRDGEALHDPDSLASKLNTKGDVLDQILGYRVENHLVQINYYPPRGDAKEAWDNIDVSGFLGQRMQLKVNFLCRDSVLAAPLVIEIARCLDLAHRRGEAGPIEPLGVFFKAPMVADGHLPVHAFDEQERRFRAWLALGPVRPEQARPPLGAVPAAADVK